ncbi:lantibiotic dehydratase [Actinomadura nitritigenes]|uniref:Lantibiotic dehydratase n=1 Tax=Actinomadura nitritigenes TaxID=134602 RepID=A0ABS3R254_9ACTN|nr:lantibiotic dehydratase [Actinomadura nitritigenes]MBO2440266.1 lantibiotic dehydratase [Actinomadura nitritigenes]
MVLKTPASYQWQPSALLRATTVPDGIAELLPRDLQIFGEDAAERGREWLTDVWRNDQVRNALEAASPALVGRVQDVLDGRCRQQRRVRRVVLSVASYLLRWQGRPTPFGLFAGVAPARIGDGAQVSWGSRHLTTVRTDADWLADIIVRLQQCHELLRRLPIVANDAGRVRGDRFVVPGAPEVDRAKPLAPLETSVRHTRALAAALEAAREPARFADLCDGIAARFAAVASSRIEAMLIGLVKQNVLITSLWAPMTRLDALGHVCAELRAVKAETIDDVSGMVRRLYEIHEKLDIEPSPASWRTGIGLADQMRALSDAAPVPLIVDTALDCRVQIPVQVAREAQDAVAALYRLTPQPFGYQHWRDYHGRFRDRYGAGAVVPVMDLVADSGLGLPAEYLGSAYRRTARPLTDRDENLLALVQQTLLDGADEIVLTDHLVEDLAVGDADEMIPVPRAELAVEIHASSSEAIARGSFRLVVTGTPRPGSSMAGRFAHLLPEPHRNRLAATYRTADSKVISAQLSFAPRRRRNDNVARTPQLLPHVIALSEHRSDRYDVIGLDDLAVAADARQFFLIQLSTGRRVEPRVVHALEAGVHTPPLARFLAEIVTARCAVYKAFDFGAAAHLPYLPRVRYGRTILSPARWLLAATDLPGRRASMAEWEVGLRAWQARLRAGDRVTMVDDGQRLPLDLTHRFHRALLRTRLDSARRLELRETPSPDDLAWIGRAHEVLLPFTSTAPTTARPPVPVRSPYSVVAPEAAQLPGRSRIVYAQMHAHPLRYNEILIVHLPELLQALEPQPRWWFRRHRRMAHPESGEYLAVYLELPHPDLYGQVAEAIHEWAAGRRSQRLLAEVSLATYGPQTGRYGHGPAMDAAHTVFAADAAAALLQIKTAEQSTLDLRALAATSMIDLASSLSASSEECLTWLIEHLPRGRGPLDRALRQQCLDLADCLPDLGGNGPAAWPSALGPQLPSAWRARRSAAAKYRTALESQRDPTSVLRSLLHLHYVRAIGVDPDLERLTGRLARDAALRHVAIGKGTR